LRKKNTLFEKLLRALNVLHTWKGFPPKIALRDCAFSQKIFFEIFFNFLSMKA
jgi:hypothetical protein